MSVAQVAVSEDQEEIVTLLVDGGRRLDGAVEPGGFKHSLVTVVAAACAANAPVTIANCPALLEAEVLAQALAALGVRVARTRDELSIDARDLTGGEVDGALARRIHGAAYLAPALLARYGRASVAADGGCRIGDDRRGARPYRHYVAVLERFGARVVAARADSATLAVARLRGCELDLLDFASHRALRSGPHYSGATKMALLAAAVAHGPSVLRNPYPKRDVLDLVEALAQLGADIERRADGALVIRGRGCEALSRPLRHALVPDLIELMTWICAGTLLAGESVTIRAPRLDDALAGLTAEVRLLEDMGVQLDAGPDRVVVRPLECTAPLRLLVTSGGIYSDSQPFFALLATLAHGDSTIADTVWARRFGYAPGLRALGARLTVRAAELRIAGPCRPRRAGQHLEAPDLRAAAALLLAALAVEGETTIAGAQHLARGYVDLPGKLSALGARIEEVQGP